MRQIPSPRASIVIVKNFPERWVRLYEKDLTESSCDALRRILERRDFKNEGDFVVLDFYDDTVYLTEYEEKIQCNGGDDTVAMRIENLRKIGLFIAFMESGD